MGTAGVNYNDLVSELKRDQRYFLHRIDEFQLLITKLTADRDKWRAISALMRKQKESAEQALAALSERCERTYRDGDSMCYHCDRTDVLQAVEDEDGDWVCRKCQKEDD